MDARIEAALKHLNFSDQLPGECTPSEANNAIREVAQEAGKILAQIAAEFDPKRYTEDISEALLRAVDVKKSQS